MYNRGNTNDAISELGSIANTEQINLNTFANKLSQYRLPFSDSVANIEMLRSNTVSYMKALLKYDKDYLVAKQKNNWDQVYGLLDQVNNFETQFNNTYKELKQKEDSIISSATNYFN